MSTIESVLEWPDEAGTAHAPLRIKYYQHNYVRVADQALLEHGTTMARYVLLKAIENNPGSSGVQLAELTFQRPQSVADTAGALEKQELIERRRGRGRALGHYLAEAGQAQLDESRAVITDLHKRIFTGFDEARLTRFLGDLDQITANLTEVAVGPREPWPTFVAD